MYSKNKKKVALVLFSIATLLVSSCRENPKAEDKTVTTKTQTTTPVNKSKVGAETGDAVALNPAHGQPGHRCDIKVGAPLDSAPVKPNSQTSDVVLDANALPKGTPNPAHGQPGHRCDVKVGEAL